MKNFNNIAMVSIPNHSTGKNPTGNKYQNLDISIIFYKAENSDDTEEIEEAKILVEYDLRH